MNRLALLSLGCAAACLALPAFAEVKLPHVLAEHMVIQRDLPVHIWGTATPGEAVTVSFRGATRAASQDTFGRWSVYLPPCEAGGPYELKLQGANVIEFHDVLCGDVWVASGQSNMEMPVTRVANARSEIEAANYPRLRLYRVKNQVAGFPQEDAEAYAWTPTTPDSVADFSAVAYFFGRDLQRQLNVPIGLVESNWGGTPAEAWTSLPALSADASLMPAYALWARRMSTQATAELANARADRQWQEAAAKAKAAGQAPPARPWRENMDNCWQPGGLYNAMIAPLTPMAIKGVIWYQGESNAGPERASWYGRVFQTLIRDWRAAWGLGDFPFLYVQIANWKSGADAQWPLLRDQQRQTLALAHTAMTVTIDIGDPADIHPKNKQAVGARLALAARAVAYGEKLEYSGPLFRQLTREGSALRVWFDHVGAGLRVNGGDTPTGFEIAAGDGKWIPAETRLEGNTVVLSAHPVTEPVAVRYGWKDVPECNLFNAEGLPASPFASHTF
jgi:sialate O-acetylesterase